MELYLSIPRFSVLDIRPDTKLEMRLMLGTYTDISKPGICDISASSCVETATDIDASNLTMLIMDYRWRSSFQSLVIRIQQPRVLVVLDFLLAVAEYFVPSLGTVTGKEETMDRKNDPLMNSDDIILSEPVYMQREDVVRLSPRRQ